MSSERKKLARQIRLMSAVAVNQVGASTDSHSACRTFRDTLPMIAAVCTSAPLRLVPRACRHPPMSRPRFTLGTSTPAGVTDEPTVLPTGSTTRRGMRLSVVLPWRLQSQFDDIKLLGHGDVRERQKCKPRRARMFHCRTPSICLDLRPSLSTTICPRSSGGVLCQN
jgi:hypothetical protein